MVETHPRVMLLGLHWGHLKGKACALFLLALAGPSTVRAWLLCPSQCPSHHLLPPKKRHSASHHHAPALFPSPVYSFAQHPGVTLRVSTHSPLTQPPSTAPSGLTTKWTSSLTPTDPTGLPPLPPPAPPASSLPFQAATHTLLLVPERL